MIKICGVTNEVDARACADAGADAVGFNLWPKSKRFVRLEVVAGFALPSSLLKVAVFVDPSPEEVAAALGVVDVVQFHGAETPEFCARVAAGRFWKAIRLVDEQSLTSLATYGGDLALVDADRADLGGTGRPPPMALAVRAARSRRILLAGGLDADNVAAAVAAIRPAGVDVASGVERSPGQQDPARVAAFVVAARAALERSR